MFSYHPRKVDYDGKCYAKGYQVVNSKELHVVAAYIKRHAWSPIIWRGGHRLNHNFLRADFIALDFDGEMGLNEAIESVFCDMCCIIGTTRSHQKPKNLVIADRFRVVIKLQLPITRLEQYNAKVGEYIERYDSDPTGIDGARFFWPCHNIVFVNPDGLLEEVGPDFIPSKRTYTNEDLVELQRLFKDQGARSFPPWLREFLDEGKLPEWAKGGRNITCYHAAKKLLVRGIEPDKVEEMLRKSPFNKKGFSDKEFKTTVKSALKWLTSELKKGGMDEQDKERQGQEAKRNAKEWLKGQIGS